MKVDEIHRLTPYCSDANGNCAFQTDAGGNIVEQYYYDAFGKPYFFDGQGAAMTVNGQPGSVFGNRFLFTGREYLSELKLYDYRNRLYQPELGRFMQPDPKQFEAGDYNLYRYCHNDPVNKSDPSGLAATFIFKDGTRVQTESGTEFAKIAANAEKGSLDAIIIQGHGTSSTQSFNSSGPARKSDSAIVRAGDGKAYVVDPKNKSNGGVVGEVGSLLAGKFHSEGGARIGMIGCNTSNAKENVTKSVSASVPSVTVYGEPRNMSNAFWSGIFVPYPFGSHVYPSETVYVNGELQR